MYMIIVILNLSQVKPIQPLILWINLWKKKKKKTIVSQNSYFIQKIMSMIILPSKINCIDLKILLTYLGLQKIYIYISEYYLNDQDEIRKTYNETFSEYI